MQIKVRIKYAKKFNNIIYKTGQDQIVKNQAEQRTDKK